jgi:hypothetical protein
MKSLTSSEAQEYCRGKGPFLDVERNALSYRDSDLPRFVISAPTELRRAIAFVLALTNATAGSSFADSFIWFGRSDVGVLDSAYLGRKIIEGLRLVNGDHRSLEEAPAQIFDENSKTEFEIFLLQAILFGWPGQCLFGGCDYIINFTSSQRWFFRCREHEKLTSLFYAMAPWNPVYDNSEF